MYSFFLTHIVWKSIISSIYLKQYQQPGNLDWSPIPTSDIFFESFILGQIHIKSSILSKSKFDDDDNVTIALDSQFLFRLTCYCHPYLSSTPLT